MKYELHLKKAIKDRIQIQIYLCNAELVLLAQWDLIANAALEFYT